MDDMARLVAAFQEMRKKEGITDTKLLARGWLLDLLHTPGDPLAGIKQLSEVIDAMGDSPKTRAVRNALNIGMEWHGELDDRRKWAYGLELPKGEAFLGVSRGTQYSLENDGFQDLARRIVAHSTTITYDEELTPDDGQVVDEQARETWWEFWRQMFREDRQFAGVAAVVFILLALALYFATR
ncbi:hypothetical protein ACIQBJ_32055 [Kitasatospora sp. NPDC088391]|uniref:hypothetical protein n=1 Tax=Kitasatospora sp. NPDC088391 TaxID=3364074 RepID=UPI00380EFB00